jgi:hypothetical protein
MPTTTNFGWTTPADTDLVKDGAAAIRTLAGNIDTSLVDLKGGTTGQILSKTSNTDLDFTWVASSPGDITAVNAGAGLSGGGSSGDVTLAINTPYVAKTANYTVASGDEGKLFSMNNAAAQTFSIPTDATFDFAVGTTINFIWLTGAGQPTIAAVTSGTTTIVSTGAAAASPKLRAVNSSATAIKIAANSWVVVGDLA